MRHLDERCTGCLTCQMICSLVHGGESRPSLSRVQLRREGECFTARFTPGCDECARCARFCPNGALVKEK